MKVIFAALMLVMAGFSLRAGTIQAGTNIIQGSVGFANADAGILARLGPPGNEGMTGFYIYAYTTGPEALSSTKGFSNTDPLFNDYALTVTANNTPLLYTVHAVLALDGSAEEYTTSPMVAAPLTSNSAPATINFSECVAVVELRYQNPGGAPVEVYDMRATALETDPPYTTGARCFSQPPGRTNSFLIVPSGVELALAVEVDIGGDIYSNRLTHVEHHLLTLNCDEQSILVITVPATGNLGAINGSVNMVGEIELPTDGYQELLGRPVIRARGPAGNQRYAGPGAEFPGPDADRAFMLPNLVPSADDEDWSVYAEMQFGLGNRFEYFISPGLGAGVNNPGVVVTDGQTSNLGNTFVMHPAKLVGQVTLTGPPEFGANFSALRGLQRVADYDADTNGIPDYLGPSAIYYSYVVASGVDELAPGATLSTAGGQALSSFVGAYNPASSTFTGDYELTLGMIEDQPGLWKRDGMNFAFYFPATNGGPYVNESVYIQENEPWQGVLAPGDRATNDLRYGFAEICLRIRSSTPFYSPRVLNGSGSLNGIDSEGHAQNYTVFFGGAYGRPEYADGATNDALITMYLPEGDYTFQPSITTIDPGGGESSTLLPEVTVSAVAGQRLCIEDCLRVAITPPLCTTNFGFLAFAIANSCEATLTNLSLRSSPLSNPGIRLGYSDIRILEPVGLARTNLQTGHGLFPEFDGYPLEYYQDILYTAEARDNKGRVAILQIVSHYDLTPPTIECSNVVVVAANGVSTAATYSPTVTDNRPEPLIVACVPPSGSGFSVGTHTVTCRASDLCRNTNSCSFQVIVQPPACPLRIELTQLSPPETTLTWDCNQPLQCAPAPDGPWADVGGAASPFTTAAADAQKFYRLKYSQAGSALQFPGTAGASASVSFQPSALNLLPITITAWIKTSQSAGAYPGLVTKYLGGSLIGYALALDAGRLAPWYYADATRFVEPGFTGPNDRFVADGQWHHVAFVVDTGGGRTYIDGQQVNFKLWTGTANSTFTSEPLRFGIYPAGSGQPYNGELDEVTIWNAALNVSQINALMTVTPQGNEPGLRGYWRFDEASGTTASDWTGHGFNALLNGGVGWTPSTAPIVH